MATALVVSLLPHAGGKDSTLVTRFALPSIHRRLYFSVKTTGLASVISAMSYSSFGWSENSVPKEVPLT